MQGEIYMKSKSIENILKDNLKEIVQISFQPIYSLKNNKIIGYEILSRFYCEEFKNLSTEEVIKILEEKEHIHLLDFIILEKVKKYLIKKNLKLCINISPKTIIREDFLEKIINLENNIKNKMENLEIEITERGTFNYIDLICKIKKLKKLGIRIVMDDFPIGSSSLENLLESHIEGVKIDKNYMKYLSNNKGKEIYKGIVKLLKNIGSEITVEGIETEKELNFIKSIGIDLVQGYFIGKPIMENDWRNLY